jgi:hypothetical protein
MEAFPQLIESGAIRVIANPDLQEISTAPCDTGTPLDRLRQEFPRIQFPEELFPDFWPRAGNDMPVKEGTDYDDTPRDLRLRADRVREYVKSLDDLEVILVTHGGFAHFLFNRWEGVPGDSRSFGTQLRNGQARPMTQPGKLQDGAEFQGTGRWFHIGPDYPAAGQRLDSSDEVSRHGRRDCGVFTPYNLRQ